MTGFARGGGVRPHQRGQDGLLDSHQATGADEADTEALISGRET
jgi:hypothetical protein